MWPPPPWTFRAASPPPAQLALPAPASPTRAALPAAQPVSAGQDAGPETTSLDVMDQMPPPEELFQDRPPTPTGLQQPAPAAPRGYPPPGDQFLQPQGDPPGPPPLAAPGQYPLGDLHPTEGRYLQDDAFRGPAGNDRPFPEGEYGQYGPEQFPDVQFRPDARYDQGPPFVDDEAERRGLRGKRLLIPAVVVGGVAAAVVAALLLSSHGGSPPKAPVAAGGGGSTAAMAATPSATPSGTVAMTQGQAATTLSGLLAQSGGDRAAVRAAATNVQNCGQNLAQDVQVFNNAAANRRTLLTELGQLQGGGSTLSTAMVADLTQAWQVSATVDTDLAKWAQDEVGHCVRPNTNDPNYTATLPLDSQATSVKTAFVELWNPLAEKDGLPTRQAENL